jgi:hypothetical protein
MISARTCAARASGTPGARAGGGAGARGRRGTGSRAVPEANPTSRRPRKHPPPQRRPSSAEIEAAGAQPPRRRRRFTARRESPRRIRPLRQVDRKACAKGGFILRTRRSPALAEEFRIIKRQLLQAASGKTGIAADKRQTIPRLLGLAR